MRLRTATLVVVLVSMMTGCALLPTGKKKQTNRTYLIAPALDTARRAAPDCGSVQVASGQAATGFRTAKMAYMRGPYELNYFAYARWSDSPARMLADQTRRALRDSGGFDGVLESPSAVRTDFHLELADVKVVQLFTGDQSSLNMVFEARLFAEDRRTLIATKRFESAHPAGENPKGGVEAANLAAATLLPRLATFALEECSAHSDNHAN